MKIETDWYDGDRRFTIPAGTEVRIVNDIEKAIADPWYRGLVKAGLDQKRKQKLDYVAVMLLNKVRIVPREWVVL